MSRILYHYTAEQHLASIKENGLLPLGLNWFTSTKTTENTVMSHGRYRQGRISIKLKLDKFNEHRESKRSLFECFMNVDMIDMISDTSNWYFTEDIIEPKDILSYEILQDNGKWINYEST